MHFFFPEVRLQLVTTVGSYFYIFEQDWFFYSHLQ